MTKYKKILGNRFGRAGPKLKRLNCRIHYFISVDFMDRVQELAPHPRPSALSLPTVYRRTYIVNGLLTSSIKLS